MLSLRRNVDGHATRVAFDKTFVTDVTIFVIHKLLTLAIILRFLPFQRKFIVFIVPLCPLEGFENMQAYPLPLLKLVRCVLLTLARPLDIEATYAVSASCDLPERSESSSRER